MFGRIAIILVIAVVATAPAHAQPEAAQLIAECDRLAASDMDAARPASAPGVATPAIDAQAALPACLAAAKAAPADARIMFQLGRALHAAQQPDKARTAYQLADKRDHAGAAVNLGIQFQHGVGGPRDLSEARNFYEKAAKAGHPSAIHLLADLHANGNGVPKDGAQAQRLYLEALPIFEKYAAANSATAMFVLGGMYENGRGTTRDVALAKQWYEKALAGGYQLAAQSLQRLGVATQPTPSAQPPAASQSRLTRIHLRSVAGARNITAVLSRTGDTAWEWVENNATFRFQSQSENEREIVIYDKSRDIYHVLNLTTRQTFWRHGSAGALNPHYAIVATEPTAAAPSPAAQQPAKTKPALRRGEFTSGTSPPAGR